MENDIYNKIVEITENELSGQKHLYFEHISGLIGTVFNKAHIKRMNPIPEEYLDAIKEGLCNYFYGGCEPEFDTEEQYNNWESINNKNFEYIIGRYGWKKSPYQDKTLPYLIKINKIKL
jgi:hypothetical protein